MRKEGGKRLLTETSSKDPIKKKKILKRNWEKQRGLHVVCKFVNKSVKEILDSYST
jgi:hypothetical protein